MNFACRSEDKHAAPPRELRRAFVAWMEDVRPRLAVALHNDLSTPDGIEFHSLWPIRCCMVSWRTKATSSCQWTGLARFGTSCWT